MQFGISIIMSVLFRGVQQEFSNVFHYRNLLGQENDAEGLLDELVGIWRPLHGTDVSFRRGRVWTAGGSRAENKMVVQKDLTGTGSAANNTSLDRERAILARWRVGVDTRGLPVYLRKWIHSCGNPMGVMAQAGHLQNTLKIGAPDLALIQTQVEKVRELGPTEVYNLCGPKGDRIAEEQCVIHPWWEHHQLGDMWRG